MSLQTSRFKYISKGFKETMVLIPGWATDYRIFSGLDLDYNYLLSVRFNPIDFKERLLRELKERGINKISILGVSLGGFLGVEFFRNNPGRVDKLILISIRKRYDSKDLRDIAFNLKKNKKAWLYKFYLNCFSKKDKKGRSWFKKELLTDYLKTMELPKLLCGLKYLSSVEFKPELLRRFRGLTIIHGRDDLIAPFKEAIEIKTGLPEAKFIALSNSGHIPFSGLLGRSNLKNEIASCFAMHRMVHGSQSQ
ncbi:MAG: alpha/beta hydrolase [Candidatus Omnitrophota bacterium]|nr:alpha/beta hydrolase [Candidatus Omnitrophota bacterium]